MKPHLLFLSAYLPSPSAPQAGQKTAFRHLHWLSQLYDISLIAFRNEAEREVSCSELKAICREVHLFNVTKQTRIAGACRKPGVPLLVSARWHAGFRTKLREVRKLHEFARVHCEWSQMAEYLSDLPAISDRWISAHEVVSQFYERKALTVSGLKSAFWHWEAARAKQWEKLRYGQAHTILIQSAKDAALLNELVTGKTRVKVIPPYFERYRPRMRKSNSAGPVLLFWGALSRAENSEAALWLGRELLPELLKDLPNTRLILAGSNPPANVRALASDRVTVTGFIENPQAVFDQANMAVLPLFRGAGIKVKVIECLAAGLPVLTNTIGSEGIAAGESDGLFVREPDARSYTATLRDWWRSEGRLETISWGAAVWGERFAQGADHLLVD